MEFSRVVQQLGRLLDEETAALQSGDRVSLADFNFRKSHGLLEITRAMSSVSPAAARAPQFNAMMIDFRAKLEKNRRVVKLHLDAVQEVAEVLSDAIRSCESDGTYSRTSLLPGGGY